MKPATCNFKRKIMFLAAFYLQNCFYFTQVQGVALSNDVPEFYRNIQRGIANCVQLDLAAFTVNTADSLTVEEVSAVWVQRLRYC